MFFRQSGAECGAHALCAVTQAAGFTRDELQAIAARLDMEERQIGADAASLGRNANAQGNYNIQVLAEALMRRGIALTQCNAHVPLAEALSSRNEILVHRNNHWLAWRRSAGCWHCLDSQAKRPVPMTDWELVAHAGGQMRGHSYFVLDEWVDGSRLLVDEDFSTVGSDDDIGQSVGNEDGSAEEAGAGTEEEFDHIHSDCVSAWMLASRPSSRGQAPCPIRSA